MAITLVGSTTAEQAAGGFTLTFSLTGLGVQESDLLVALCVGDTAVSVPPDWFIETGWSDFGSARAGDPGVMARRIYYKLAGAAEADPGFDYASDSGANTAFGILAVFRGVDTTTPVEASTLLRRSTGATPDPQSVTTLTNKAWVIALEGNDGAVNGAGSPYPAGYTGIQYADSTDAAGPGAGMAYKEIATAGPEDPGTFALSVSEQWIADTLVLRAAATALEADTRDGGARTVHVVDTRRRERAEEEGRRERERFRKELRAIVDRALREAVDGEPPERTIERTVERELTRQGFDPKVRDIAALIAEMRAQRGGLLRD